MKKSALLDKIKHNIVVTESITFASAMGEKNISTNAASITFFFFISVIPIFILLCSMLPFTGISEAELTQAVIELTPKAVSDLVESLIHEAYSYKMGIFSISVVFLLWSSSRAMLAMVRSLDFIYDEDDNRSYVSMVSYSVLYTILFIALAGFLLLLYTKEKTADDILMAAFSQKSIFRFLAERIYSINVIATVMVICMIMYKFLPAGKRRMLFQIPGAMFSGAAIAAFSAIFAIYNDGSNIYKSFYGSLTSIALFLVWMYTCFNIILIGAVINTHFKTRFENVHFRIKTKRRVKKEIKKEKKLNKLKNRGEE